MRIAKWNTEFNLVIDHWTHG